MRFQATRHALPKVSDGWTFLYTEHTVIEQAEHAVALTDVSGIVRVPVASSSALLLGPGTSITHAAVKNVGDAGCATAWVGEGIGRYYAAGYAPDQRTHHLQAQAAAWADSDAHMEVVRRMYAIRFDEVLDHNLELAQIRGREGIRVREAYAEASRNSGVPWHGRAYRRGDFNAADPINRALSVANSVLYAICHAVVAVTGFSPGLGFIHTGKALAFIFDIADLYKTEISIPVAFEAVAGGSRNLDARVRTACRKRCYERRILERVLPDTQRVLGMRSERARLHFHRTDDDGESLEALGAVVSLWTPEGPAEGGQNHAPGRTESEEVGRDEPLDGAEDGDG